MPFTSGLALTLNEFLDDMMVYAQANGWTLLRGSSSLSDSGLYPLSTRYIRIQVSNSQSSPTPSTPEVNSILRLAGLTIRATSGGANLSLSAGSLSSSGFGAVGFEPDEILDGSNVTYWDCEPDNVAWLDYDFGSDQTIREFTLTADSTTGIYAPRDIEIYRSDDGVNWGLVYAFPTIALWTAGETKVLTLPADATNHASSTASGGVRRAVEYWLRGPGYDADRRVYLGFLSSYDFVSNEATLDLNAATAFDADDSFANMQNSIGAGFPRVNISSVGETLNYWLYVNSSRIIAVLQSSAGDYAAFYSGFLAAFGNPDEYPFPLYVGGTTNATDDRAYSSGSVANSNFWDPGTNGAYVMSPLGEWTVVNNVSTGNVSVDPLATPIDWVFPWHLGSATGLSMPYSLSGSTDGDESNHWLASLVPTLQDDLPTFDAIIYNEVYGGYGTLQGVLGIPGGGVLTVENVIAVNGDNYRTFPNRTRRGGNHWIGIQE